MILALAVGIDGIALVWRPQAVGDLLSHVIISMNALLILLTAILAIRTARKRDFVAHNQWALHLLLAMSGVWLFRVFLMLWLAIFKRPVGFDPETFTGPFLICLGLLVYVTPQGVVWAYFKSRRGTSIPTQAIFSTLMFFITIGTAVGLAAAVFGLWLPRVIR